MAAMVHDQITRHLNEAEGYLMLDMPLRALEILERRTDWATMQFEASLIAGEALRCLERYREAAKAQLAAALRPLELKVAFPLAWCYKRTHRLAQAIATLERIRDQHLDDPLIHYNLACYWSLAGNRAKALDALAQSLEIAPEVVKGLISEESDFDTIRDDPEFQRLIAN